MYPRMPDLKKLTDELALYAQLKAEYGAPGIAPVLAAAERALRASLAHLKKLPVNKTLRAREPDDLERIRALRPAGPRRLWQQFDAHAYRDRIAGALIGRMAGCTLGAPVEFWPVEKMQALAEELGDAFPPTDYWRRVPDPHGKRYNVSRREAYSRAGMAGVPVDDDIAYTLLGLLIAEDYGPAFTLDDVGNAWLQYLPYACTAEDIALRNLKKGVPAAQAGARDNPYCEWIGADIRADPWGYMAPGWPECAAAMAYRDAYLSHRRQGVYGAMFFAAAIAAAFCTSDPLEALRIGLTEIPRDCALARAVRWALRVAPTIKNHSQARAAVDAHFKGMSGVHTINNACLTIWGITIGGTDFTRVIGETVAMGLDNDCTAATAGSIVGAVIGVKNIPARWYSRFNDTIHSYLIGKKRFSISGMLRRFDQQARRVHRQPGVPGVARTAARGGGR